MRIRVGGDLDGGQFIFNSLRDEDPIFGQNSERNPACF